MIDVDEHLNSEPTPKTKPPRPPRQHSDEIRIKRDSAAMAIRELADHRRQLPAPQGGTRGTVDTIVARPVAPPAVEGAAPDIWRAIGSCARGRRGYD